MGINKKSFNKFITIKYNNGVSFMYEIKSSNVSNIINNLETDKIKILNSSKNSYLVKLYEDSIKDDFIY